MKVPHSKFILVSVCLSALCLCLLLIPLKLEAGISSAPNDVRNSYSVSPHLELSEMSATGMYSGQLGGISITVQTDAVASPPFTFTFESPRESVPLYQHRLQWGGNGRQPGFFESPDDVIVDSQGNLYVADNLRVQKFSPQGDYLTHWGSNGIGDGEFGKADGIALDASENLYIADGQTDTIYKYSVGITTAVTYTTPTTSNDDPRYNIIDLDVDSNGVIYVLDEGYVRVQMLDSSGQFLGEWSVDSGNPGVNARPTSIRLGPDGHLYVSDTANHSILVFDTAGNRLGSLGSSGNEAGQFSQPENVAWDATGNLYVADMLNSRIQIFSSSGQFIGMWGSSGSDAGELGEPRGIAVSASGDLYIVERSNHRLQIVEPRAAVQQITGVVAGEIAFIPDLLPGSYTVTQVLPAGWILTDASCTNGALTTSVANGLVIEIDSASADCTFTVTDQPIATPTSTLIPTSTSTPNFTPTSILTPTITPPTATPVPPTATPEPPTATPEPPTLTPEPPTPTQTPVPNLSLVSVVGKDALPVPGAHVFADGQLLGETDPDGQLEAALPDADTALIALAQQAEFGTARNFHDGWAYRAYQTNIQIATDGSPLLYRSTGDTMQTLSVSTTNALILFNLVVSIEWDATDAYLDDVAEAVQKAADLLYDATDGQMSFEQVTIYDNATAWKNADIQISAKNVVHPHAYVGGLTDEDSSHLIRVGRAWDGISGANGLWSNDEGYQTLVHEFGHYALGLYDEYFGYREIDGQLAGRTEAFCTSPESRGSDPDSSNASIMDYHYVASELADDGRWSEWCQKTAQHLLNNGQSDWATVKQYFSDLVDGGQSEPRWALISPDERAGIGNAVPGPYALPEALPFPQITIENTGADPTPFAAQVCYNNLPYQQGAWVTLTRVDGTVMDQGLTSDIAGQLDILGASNGDEIHVVSVNGVLAASAMVESVLLSGTVELQSVAALSQQRLGQSDVEAAQVRADELPPFMRLWPTTSGGTVDGIRMVIDRTTPDDQLKYSLIGPDDGGVANSIPYDTGEGNHNVQVGFVPAGNTGFARALGVHALQVVDLNVDYRQQSAQRGQETDLFSNDGNLMLHLETSAFASERLHFLIASPWGLPGPVPSGKTIIGEVYDITAAENVTLLDTPAVLRIRYDGQGVEGTNIISPTIVQWDPVNSQWVEVESVQNLERQEVTASITRLGIYALMGQEPEVNTANRTQVYTGPNACSNVVNPNTEVIPSVYLPLISGRP